MTTATKTSGKARNRRMARMPADSGGDNEQAGTKKTAAGIAKTGTKTSATTKKSSKTELVLGMLRRAEGATLDQMVEATGWLPHTTRAALTGLKKKGHMVTSEKLDGVRTYRVAAFSNA
ncbi:hypothetical protein GCM10023115_00340 [Pontixanthobacter gangjinensis]|uniref:DUF3489 domain-containing protein n=1 Tax=Pontixanthobacter gangjinensis TaxID=1028742 RepID=A0A6I4SI92_9SPHN|nr:DUF3489 domain-containing protein [Pontixanthobacter gangjinensis]MXO55285.1 DUF3489 domain-containing protein [Pontixanthobacter gangjinensis]